MQTLLGRKQNLQAKLKAVSQELRRAKQTLRARQCRREINQRRCQILKTALVIVPLTAPITHIALGYVRFMRGEKYDEEPFALQGVLKYYNEISIADRGRILEAYDETWGIHLDRAQRWLLDDELRNWVTEQNASKAVAPSNKQVWLRKLSQAVQDSTGAPRANRSVNLKQRQKGQWVRRWAKRHKVTQGTFKNGERLPLRTLQAKAPGS